MEDYGIIYRIWSKTTGMSYIGQTTRKLEIRVHEHFTSDEDDKFHNAIRKLGKDDFEYETIEVCHISKINKREAYWIKHYDSYENGYNTDRGGRCCRNKKLVAERNAAISNTRQNLSEEEKKEWNSNVSKALNDLPQEEKQRLSNIRSENLKNRYASKTEEEIKEWRAKIGISRRSVYVVTNLKTHEIYEFLGAEECSKFLAITKQMLSHIINGRRRPVSGYNVIKKDGK